MNLALEIDNSALERFYVANHIRRMSLFGSHVIGTSRPDSDLDVLVEFEPSQQPGLLGLSRMAAELSAMIDGRRVDLRTPKDLSRHFREEVLRASKVIFSR
jgi:predicted nucleotidyltransferase